MQESGEKEVEVVWACKEKIRLYGKKSEVQGTRKRGGHNWEG